jgi:uncharacterized protein (DUF1697 family)
LLHPDILFPAEEPVNYSFKFASKLVVGIMQKYLALIRGINVGGVVLKMEDLRQMMEELGFINVTTYIQSGNAIFQSNLTDTGKIAKQISEMIRERAGIEAAVIVKTSSELEKIVSKHPLAGEGEEKKLYVTVLSDDPGDNEIAELTKVKSNIDKHLLQNHVVYSYYGEGYGNSRMSNNFLEKTLKVRATTRNWNTMKKLNELMKSGTKKYSNL